jgi:allantoin racemase
MAPRHEGLRQNGAKAGAASDAPTTARACVDGLDATIGTAPLKPILLINPNSSRDTTAMMVEIARSCAPVGATVVGATAARSPPMIVTAEALTAAADEVVEIGTREAPLVAGIIVGAFGDPGLTALRRQVSVPVVGICEASMIEAAADGRRFGVATVTPQLAVPIEARARDLKLHHLYSGIRLTQGDPVMLAANPTLLQAALGNAVRNALQRIMPRPSSSAAGRLAKRRSAWPRRSKSPSLHRSRWPSVAC